MKRRQPSLKQAFDAPREPRWLLIALAGTIAGCVASVFLALALIGYGWGWFAAAAVTYAAALLTANGAQRALTRRTVLALLSIVALATVGALLGSLSTELVGNRPVATWSPEARTAADIRSIDTHLRALQRADALLVLDQTATRARLEEISTTRSEMRDLAASVSGAAGATDETTAAFQSIAKSADAAAEALDGKIQLAQQYDSRVETEVAMLRDTVIAEALQAGQYTRQAAARIGITVGVQE
jgi:hypothetical protein